MVKLRGRRLLRSPASDIFSGWTLQKYVMQFFSSARGGRVYGDWKVRTRGWEKNDCQCSKYVFNSVLIYGEGVVLLSLDIYIDPIGDWNRAVVIKSR